MPNTAFLYRDHKGTLADSMDTVQEMADFAELASYVEKRSGAGVITVEPYSYDKRIEWDVYLVCNDGQAVGYTNGPVIAKN